MRLILVPTADRPECAIALEVAFDIARRVTANVTGYHIRADRREQGSDEGGLLVAREAHARKGGGLTSKKARALYAATAERHGFEIIKRARIGARAFALWHEMVGSPARVFGIIGPLADLTVVSRPKSRSAGRARAFLLAALLNTARPVLVVPQTKPKSIGNTIVIAWNQSTDAALAVSSALLLLQRAQRVVVVSSGAENHPGPKSSHLAQYLAHWDIAVERVHTMGRNVEGEIKRAYRDVGGDLLLMGAYSRTRVRELVFGGMTEHMLFKAEMPVLMLHR